MPFKDIATVDSLLLRRTPDAAKAKERQAIRRLQDAGLGVVVPVDELLRTPIPNAVALVPLSSLPAPGTPPPAGAIRVAVAVRGDESDADMARLVGSDAVSGARARTATAVAAAAAYRVSAAYRERGVTYRCAESRGVTYRCVESRGVTYRCAESRGVTYRCAE